MIKQQLKSPGKLNCFVTQCCAVALEWDDDKHVKISQQYTSRSCVCCQL